MVYEAIKKLVTYGMETGLISEEEKIYSTNLILDVLKLDDYEEPEENYEKVELEPVLKELLDYAVEKGLIEDSVVYRDLFDTRLPCPPASSIAIISFLIMLPPLVNLLKPIITFMVL